MPPGELADVLDAHLTVARLLAETAAERDDALAETRRLGNLLAAEQTARTEAISRADRDRERGERLTRELADADGAALAALDPTASNHAPDLTLKAMVELLARQRDDAVALLNAKRDAR